MKGIYVFFADGFEDIEALAPVDVLRRAGLEVTLVSIAKLNCSFFCLLISCLLYDIFK